MVNFHSFDNLDFITSVMALARSARMQGADWRTYASMLENVGRRKGEDKGFASKLKYGSQWIVDNIYRGNIKDMTEYFEGSTFKTKTLDHFTRNRDLYPALADSANYARIRSIENGYRNHRFHYIKTIDLGAKDTRAAFHDGDVVALVSNLKNLDVTHMGIVVREDPSAEPYLLHASYSDGKVEVTARPLADFMKKNRQWLGLRVFRLAE